MQEQLRTGLTLGSGARKQAAAVPKNAFNEAHWRETMSPRLLITFSALRVGYRQLLASNLTMMQFKRKMIGLMPKVLRTSAWSYPAYMIVLANVAGCGIAVQHDIRAEHAANYLAESYGDRLASESPLHFNFCRSRCLSSSDFIVAIVGSTRYAPRLSADFAYLPLALSDAQALGQLQGVRRLDLRRCELTDEHLRLILCNRELEELCLAGLPITDSVIVEVSQCISLRKLDLSDTLITDDGLAHLGKMSSLRSLNLDGTQITDCGTEYLRMLRDLEELRFYRTAVSPNTVSALDLALPHCEQVSTFVLVNTRSWSN